MNICRTCLGCNKLLNPDFIGKAECPNYVRGDKDEKRHTFSNKQDFETRTR